MLVAKTVQFLSLLLSLFFCYTGAELAPEEEPVVEAFRHLRTNQQRWDTLLNRLPFDVTEAYQSFREANYAEGDLVCGNCTELIDLVKFYLDTGGSYEEIRDVAISTCNDTLFEAGFNKSEVMCPKLMDMYIPPVINILNAKPMEAREICTRLNLCETSSVSQDSMPALDSTPRKRKVVKTDNDELVATGSDVTQNTFKVIQINDLHVDLEYEEGAAVDCGYLLCCRKRYEGNGKAATIGEYTCNTNPKVVEMILDKINTLNPEFVLYLGDNPCHALWEETLEVQNNQTKRVIDMIAKRINGTKTYPAIGNHETYPTNLYHLSRQETQALNDMIAEKWPTISPLGQEQIDTIKKAAYYSILLKPGLRLLSYNSNYGYIFNFYTLLIHKPDEADYLEMKQFMDSTLTQARANGEKVVLLGHHPIGNFDSELNHAQWLTDFVLKFQDIIVLHVHGHTHLDGYKLFVDENDGQAKSVSFVSPSVTPYTDHNPAFRVYTMDSKTFQLLDYEQYYLPIQDGMNAQIQVSYSARSEYQLSDMSAQSWQQLSQRMESDRDLLLKFRRNTYTKSGREEPCEDNACKSETICQVRNTVFTKFSQCLRSSVRT